MIPFAGWLAAQYLRLVHRTSKIILEPADPGAYLRSLHPAIGVLWHGQSHMTMTMKPEGLACKTMVAKHGDGDLMGHALSAFGAELIRGSGGDRNKKKDKGGAQALRAALRALNENYYIVLTADMPGSPPRVCSPGVIMMARLSGRPIVPGAIATSRFITLNTWSRMVVNLPFSRMAQVFGDPVWVPREADEATLEACRLAVEAGLNAATARAYELAGRKFDLQEFLYKPKARYGLLLRAYLGLSTAIQPAAGIILRARSRRGKEIAERLGERTGEAGVKRPDGPLWWFHAASVGETNAILPLLHELKRRHPALNLLLTTVTVTSSKIAAARLPEGAIHQFVPIDTPASVRRFLDHWRPDLALFTESEIWPNMIVRADERGIPLILLNARMSDRSYERWTRLKSLSRPLFSRFDLVLAQSARLAKRIEKVGGRRVMAAGNLKFDAPPPPVDAAGLDHMRALAGGRPVFLAASTHPGEDEAVIEAHKAVRAKIPGLLTVIVPRHPERGAEVAALAAGMGVTAVRRSEGAAPGPATDIYIADTLGEMGIFYSLARIAFIGGSLVNKGGQSPIEAVKLGAAVVSGPYVDNQRDAYTALESCNGCRMVTDAASLANTLDVLYTQPSAAKAMHERAAHALAALEGALGRTLEALQPYLPPQPAAPAEAPGSREAVVG